MDILQEAAQHSGLTIEQLKQIEELIQKQSNFTIDRIQRGVYTFCCKIGMNKYYFATTPIKDIAQHIESILAAEIIAINRGSKELDVDFVSEREDSAMYLLNDDHEKAVYFERRLEDKYPASRMQSYRTPGIDLESHFRSYYVTKPIYVLPDAPETEADINKVAAKQFLEMTTEEAIERYQKVMRDSLTWDQPYITVTENVRDETRIMISVPYARSRRFLAGISDVINNYGLVSKHKYAEPFSNGRFIISLYLDAKTAKPHIDDLITDISLIYIHPENELSPLILNNILSAHEAFYARSAWKFTHQFLSSFNQEYVALNTVLKDRPDLIDILHTLRTRLVKDAYTENRIVQSIFRNPDYIKELYRDFAKRFGTNGQSDTKKTKKMDFSKIQNEIDRAILEFFQLFNNSVLKTNFYKKEKTSLAFRLNPELFLDKIEYKETPYGVFMVLGKEFRGFHVRFRDIARGGIRIVKSRDAENYDQNSDSIFDENYNLAFTQQKKNKDIPEGGSKGTILLNLEFQDKGEVAFEKYVDGILDLILPDSIMKDNFGKEEILFLGPDEGTAELMSWAASRARERGYKFWKAFSTGKPLIQGGIPHDVYGMTTNSTHEYVLGILKKLNIKEENITKVQTGGPDGDLGSNEILISKDKTLCVIDGSGVLYDPEGIDRKELSMLAQVRVMIEKFDKKKLSKNGFLVHVNDHNVKLPDGTIVESGLNFRNSFHLNPILKADLFMPCGGRPKSINIQNWTQLLDKTGMPRFKYIVEGANLFLTQPARLALEKKGVIIFKDASANKGGVTSSSLEVLASLAMTDEEYDKHLCVKSNNIPPFREKYVEEVLQTIRENAQQEFEVLWNENKNNGVPLAILTDQLSDKINQMTDSIHRSDLWKDKTLVKAVVEQHCPAMLIELVGIEEILRRVPLNYQQAIVSSWLASQFIYRFGLHADEIDFHNFLRQYSC